ncbi:MAG: DUF3048 domain-containing protein [Actinomycetota bacterium]|nr:DUF3048 domain-containing protein [Actinomycetota bacterium]
MNFPRRSLSIVCVAALSVALASCSGNHHAAASPPASHTATPTASPTPTPTPAAPAVNPFTGGPPSANSVVAVKIDDTDNGRPQVNIDQADIVYIEQVEGGLTRLLAIYNTRLPTVEAVRSTRASDPELVAQYGPIAYVASGGAPNPLQVLDQSKLKSSINDRGGPGFARDPNRSAPYNLTANLALAAQVLHAPKAKSIGLTWLANVNLASRPAAPTIQTVVGGTPVRFDWNAGLHKFVRVINGALQYTAAGRLIATRNVIVQFCNVTLYPQDVDVMGNPSQYTHTVGTGRMVVFRDGRRIDGTWSRPKATDGTAYLGPTGQPVNLAPGGVWVILVASNAALVS